MHTRYGFGRAVTLAHADARTKTVAALAAEGFGIVSEIDLAAAFRNKIGHPIPPYVILGACDPRVASQAVAAEPSIGLLLPCNVVVREDAAGAVHVEVLDPEAMFALVDQPGVGPLAADVRARLARAIEAI
jgi:uncharacterized protein (DUF302 family)